MVKQIFHQDQCLALFIPNQNETKGTQFFTNSAAALQVGLIARTTGDSIPAHRHLPINIQYTGIRNEFIYVKKGRVTVTIFADNGDEVCQETLVAGDAMLQLLGGHGFYFEEPTQLIEVKQGPYANQQQDKVLYETICHTSP